MARVRQNQLFEGKSWNGFTDKNHLISAYDYDVTQIFNRLEQVLDVNLGENFVSMVMQHGVHYIDKGKEIYEWYLENVHQQNYELLGAFEDEAMARVIGTTVGLRTGANRSEFYMLFENRPFAVTEIIVGMKPDLYRLWITDDPKNVGGDRWLYRVQLIAGSEVDYIDADEILPGTMWSSDGGLVPQDLNDTGFGPDLNTHLFYQSNRFHLYQKVS